MERVQLENIKILYAAYGDIAIDIHRQLRVLGIKNVNIYTITYEHEDNKKFIEYLNQESITFSTKPINTLLNEIEYFKPTIVLSIHFRNLIPESIVKKYRGMNLHPSLLPKYAGCLASMWQIINDEKNAGITYHLLNEKFDQGNILLQKEFPILSNETGESLFQKANKYSIDYFSKALSLLLSNTKGHVQEGTRTYFSRKIPNNGFIDIQWPESKIERYIRAFTFKGKPSCFLKVDKKNIEIKSFKQFLELSK